MAEMKKTILKIFVTGDGPTSQKAIKNLHALCAQSTHECTIDVVNIKDAPDAARNAHIVVTPTVIKDTPGPTRRFVGDLSETKHVMKQLGIESVAEH